MKHIKLFQELALRITPEMPLTSVMLEEIARLREELAAAQLDAARYRWLRDKSQPQNRNGPGLYWYLPRFMQGTKEEQLDAAIDNAMQEEGK